MFDPRILTVAAEVSKAALKLLVEQRLIIYLPSNQFAEYQQLSDDEKRDLREKADVPESAIIAEEVI